MTSLRTYVLVGVGGGLFIGILALMEPQFARSGPLVLRITSASGAIAGATFYGSRAWESHGPAANLLRWIVSFGLAGIILGGGAGLLGAISMREVPAAIGFALMVGCGFVLEGRVRSIPGTDDDRERTAREVLGLWLVLLGALAAAGSLLALSWFLTR
jgi:hypothetical protein